jgi:hypothetical protein
MLPGDDHKNGREKYEWRHKNEQHSTKLHTPPKREQWNGELAVKTTNKPPLATEQGLGDTLQFMCLPIP